MSGKPRTFALMALLALAVPALDATPARHLRLVKSEPADSAVVAAAPVDIKLWFSEDPPLNVTKISLTRGTDTVALAALTRAKVAKSPIIAKITGSMPAGSYAVDWRTMGTDGHVLKGTVRFRIAGTPTRSDLR